MNMHVASDDRTVSLCTKRTSYVGIVDKLTGKVVTKTLHKEKIRLLRLHKITYTYS